MKVGFLLVAMYPMESSEQALRVAAEMDFDSVWLPDHMLGFFHPELWSESRFSEILYGPDAFLDPFCAAAVLGRQTQLPIGMCVTDGTRRRAPDVARAALTLHHLCEGGFELGVGSGEAESLVPFGYPFDKPVGLCEEFLAELRCLLDTGRMPQRGPGRIGVPLESERGRPRVWVGGHGPRMLRLTGQYGDGWMPAWRTEPSEYAAKRDVIARHAEAAGRASPEWGLFAPTVVGESRERLAEMFEVDPIAKLATIFARGDQWQRYGLEHPAGAESRGFVDVIPHTLDADQLRELAPRIPFELIDEYMFLGNAEEIAAQLEPYARAGVDHLVLGSMLGVVGGLAEVELRTPEMSRLRKLLSEI